MLETQALGPSREAGAQSVQLNLVVTSVPCLTQRPRWRERALRKTSNPGGPEYGSECFSLAHMAPGVLQAGAPKIREAS